MSQPGPAGRVLDTAFEEAGVSRDQVYITNAVKHFNHPSAILRAEGERAAELRHTLVEDLRRAWKIASIQ